ncbi:YvrJ family protein [Paenibacillus polymyxa]|uniref:YvrJ family protein n=1 Tax=Paenibacillus polymyxa TaxID=1406 RepID=UPI002ED35861|nr:YvrJ family protein [Paenibacillus polymyxa]
MLSNTQTLSNILTAISQVGFPIVVAGYLLVRFEKKIDVLSENISRLVDAIKQKDKQKESDNLDGK